MPDTTARPTPEQLASGFKSAADAAAVDAYRARLEVHGYVIVHPDDVPVMPTTRDDYEFSSDFQDDSDSGARREHQGWNACRAHIFGDTDA